MALSVLVALMMLAVPLASSSNLFVDGGQTNSNGDAPNLGAAGDTYVLYFDFNVPENSLDAANLKSTFNGTASATNNIGTKGDGDNATAGSIEFSLIKGKTAQEDRILAYVKQPTGTGDSLKLITIGNVLTNLNTLVFDSREGYDLVSWKGTDGNSYYADSDAKIEKNMNYTANWELKSVTAYIENTDNTGSNPSTTPTASANTDPIEVTYDFKEFKVNVVIDGETKEYVKAYLVTEDADGNPIIEFNVSLSLNKTSLSTATVFNKTRPGSESIAGVGSDGFLITNYLMNPAPTEGYYVPVYNILTTDSNKKVVYNSKETGEKKYADYVSGNSQNSFNVNFELISTYTQLTISSILFDEDVAVYAYKGSSFTYADLLKFLTDPDLSGPENFEAPYITGDMTDFNSATGKLPVENNKYVLTGWNGSVLLNSTEKVTETSLTLDADTNSYKVVFMVNGEFEVVEVPFGTELSASLTKLDTNGVDHWVSPVTGKAYVSDAFSTFKEFRFSPDDIKDAETAGKSNDTFILIACFQPANKTAYAVFNAGTADFGDELVKTIVIPGEVNTPISKLPATPEKEGKNVFIGWMTPDYKRTDGKYTYTKDASKDDPIVYSSSQEYNKKNDVSSYTAKIESYKWTMSFSANGSVIGVLYYSQGASNTIAISNTDLTTNLVAYQYDGKMYKAADAKGGSSTAKDAFANIVSPLKAGYEFVQWNGAEGKKVISDVITPEITDTDYRSYTSSKQSIEKLTGDITVSAEFDAKPYIVQYANTFNSSSIYATTQIADVDETLKLFGDSVFIQEGYKLIGWSDRADGNGTKYDLGSNFTLSGEQYEKLKDTPGHLIGEDVTVTMYSIWEKVGSGSGSGDNTDRDNDNSNTDTYLLAGILVVIIILIIVVAVVLRKKN